MNLYTNYEQLYCFINKYYIEQQFPFSGWKLILCYRNVVTICCGLVAISLTTVVTEK